MCLPSAVPTPSPPLTLLAPFGVRSLTAARFFDRLLGFGFLVTIAWSSPGFLRSSNVAAMAQHRSTGRGTTQPRGGAVTYERHAREQARSQAVDVREQPLPRMVLGAVERVLPLR